MLLDFEIGPRELDTNSKDKKAEVNSLRKSVDL